MPSLFTVYFGQVINIKISIHTATATAPNSPPAQILVLFSFFRICFLFPVWVFFLVVMMMIFYVAVMTNFLGRFGRIFWRMEDTEGRSDDFLAMDVLTTFLVSRTSQGEEPLDTGGGRVSLTRCLCWSSGHC